MKAEYVDHMGNDLAVVNAARVSFDKTSTLEEVITSKPRYPTKWEVGMEVEYVRDTDEWGPQAGERGKIVRLSEDCATRRADLYQVFWVKVGSGTFWTTPDQVKLVGSTEFPKVERRLREADAKLIDYLAKHEHWTPFAHTSITLRMQAPVPIRTQCFKHKFGFVENEESRRYVSGSPKLFVPEAFRLKPEGSVKQGSGGHPSHEQGLAAQLHGALPGDDRPLRGDESRTAFAPSRPASCCPRASRSSGFGPAPWPLTPGSSGSGLTPTPRKKSRNSPAWLARSSTHYSPFHGRHSPMQDEEYDYLPEDTLAVRGDLLMRLALARDQVHATDSRDLLKAYMVKVVDSVEVPSKPSAQLIVFPRRRGGRQ